MHYLQHDFVNINLRQTAAELILIIVSATSSLLIGYQGFTL